MVRKPGHPGKTAVLNTAPHPFRERRERLRKSLFWLVLILGSLYLSYVMWGPNLKAQWSLIDDHEIRVVVDKARTMSLFDIWIHTEVGSFGKVTRFRPSYWLLRIGECFLWGYAPGAWYLARLVMFAFCVCVFVFLVSRAAGPLLAVSFVLFVMTDRYWPSIWSALGPAETYVCLGAALFALGAYGVWSLCPSEHLALAARLREVASWLLMTLGAVISMGSKENFVLLAAPTIWLAWKAHRRRTLTVAGWISTILVLACAACVSLAVGLALRASGHDIYMNSVDPGSRMKLLLDALGKPTAPTCLLLATGGGWALLRVLRLSGEKAMCWRAALARMFVAEALFCLAYLSQVYYYNGPWTADSRYAFPGQLILEFSAFLPVIVLVRTPGLLPGPAPVNARRLRDLAAAALFIGALGNGFEPAIARSRQNAALTRAATGGLERLAKATRSSPEAAVVMFSCSLGDFEPYHAVKISLRSSGLTGPIIIQKCSEGYSTAGFSPELAAELLEYLERPENGYAPLSVLDKPIKCYSIGFDRMPVSGRCEAVGKLAP